MEMDERKENKIIRINVLQVAMNVGTALGVYLIVFYLLLALAVKHAGLTLLALPMMLGIPVFAWYLIRRYRDSTNIPFFPFPVSWMLSILTFLFATALSCMAAYLYLRFLDHGELAQALMENREIVMSRERLAQLACGYDFVGETNIIDVYIRHLRSKIDDRYKLKLITTVRGVGYVIREG